MAREKIGKKLKRKIRLAEKQIERGKVTILNTKMNCKEIDRILMED